MAAYKLYTEPWEHQKRGLDYFMQNPFGAIYTDMGSGKSKIMIDVCVNREFNQVLIVAPPKICNTWVEQLKEHGNPKWVEYLNLKDFDGTKLKLTKLKEFYSKPSKRVKFAIVNYESVWREPLKQYLLKLKTLDAVICDEAHNIKSPSSKCSGMLTLLGRRVKHRYLITGTPLSQSPLDIYAQYRFLDSSIFGTNYETYKQTYANWIPIPNGYPILDKKNPYKNLDDLERKMFSVAFCIPVEQNLPPTQDVIVKFDMNKKSQKAYATILEKGGLYLKSGILTTSNILSTILRLQQLTSGYIPVENEETGEVKLIQGDTSRVDTLLEIFEDIPEEEPVVIFCRFTQDVKNVFEGLSNAGRKCSMLTGKVDTMKDWDAGKTQVLICQIRSGSAGLNNMTKARYCVYYTIHPSLALWKQSRKRTHRPGQKRPVTYYTLISARSGGITADELIYKNLMMNQSVVDDIMERGMKALKSV